MKFTVTTNMNCQACADKIAPLLDAEPTIVRWEADLDDPRKIIRGDLATGGSVKCVVELIAKAGFRGDPVQESLFAESTERNGIESPVASPTKIFRLATYKPLFLVVVYIFGATILIELAHGNWNLQRMMSSFMGFFFLGFAFFKLLDVTGFADTFATYDIVAKRIHLYGLAYPWIELALGLMFVTGTWLTAANIATAVIMGTGLIGVVFAVRRKEAIRCACLGTGFNLPMSVVTVIENTVMVVMAVAMLVMG